MILVLGALSVLFLAGRILVASRLDLLGDEAFYWMCAQRLDLAYVDHPFMTALLVRGGVELLGPTPLGVRGLFLLLGALLPWPIFLLARPLVGRQDASRAAAASLVIPVLSHGGVVAIPDVPLLFGSALALLGFERATRDGGVLAWLLAGGASAAALATHYRAVLLPVSFLAYLLLTSRGRRQWRHRGVWIALLALLPGFLPILLFNLRLDFAPLRYQLIDRHAGGFDPTALLAHVALQAAVATPLLYASLVCVLVRLVRRASSGDDRAALLVSFSLSHLGVFLLASALADGEHAAAHWPAPGYLPLLVFLPALLRDFVARRPTRGRRLAVALVPSVGLFAIVGVVLETQISLLGLAPLHLPFAGWSTAVRGARAFVDEVRQPDGRVLLVTDSYSVAGNIELRLHDVATVFVLDHPKHTADGRARQFALWHRDEAALRDRAGEPALVVLDRDQSKRYTWDPWLAHVRQWFDPLTPCAQLEADGEHPGAPRFHLFLGVVDAPSSLGAEHLGSLRPRTDRGGDDLFRASR